jgi:hypothetical protein
MLRRHLVNPASILVSLAALAAIVLMVMNPGYAAASTGNIRVNPSTQTIPAIGNTFTVDLIQNSDGTTSGAQASFSFPSNALQINSIVSGPAYGGGTPTTANTIANANTTGTLSGILAFKQPCGQPNTCPLAAGDNIFVTITMQTKACGKGNLTLSTLELLDGDGNNITVTGTNGDATSVSAVDFNTPTGQDWVTPVGDLDCDGWTDTRENFSGTLANQLCMATINPNDEAGADAWPVDYNDDQLSNGQDILKYNPKFGTVAPGGPAANQYSVRFDLNGDSLINGQDILKHNPYFGKYCTSTHP